MRRGVFLRQPCTGGVLRAFSSGICGGMCAYLTSNLTAILLSLRKLAPLLSDRKLMLLCFDYFCLMLFEANAIAMMLRYGRGWYGMVSQLCLGKDLPGSTSIGSMRLSQLTSRMGPLSRRAPTTITPRLNTDCTNKSLIIMPA